jgi:hypothetical protein
MTDPIDRVRLVKDEDRRVAARRKGERRAAAAAAAAKGDRFALALVPAAPLDEPDPGPSIFTAQLIGQDGQKRGLRGGAPVLDAARSAYLETEWSGPADRRPKSGTVAKTKI